jgi:hypothetical protein
LAAAESQRWAGARNVLRALVAAAALWTLLVAVTGGFDLRPYQIPFKSTEADRPAYAALLLVILYVALFRRAVRDDLQWLEDRAQPVARVLERWSFLLVLAAAAITFALAVAFGIHVGGGSDSCGYISQARLWLAGDLVVEQPIARGVPWPDADRTFAPLAYRPAQQPGAIVPVYAPGLPVFMAIAQFLVGQCGVYLVVPLFGAWLVWTTYRLGVLMWSPLVGLASALLVATSPTHTFMALNPMSDVPVTAFLTAGLMLALSSFRSRAFWTALVVSLGIFVRPNLLPLGAIYLGCLLARCGVGERWRTLWLFAAGGAVPVLAVAATNAFLYGAPWRAGYGDLREMYSLGYLLHNVRYYPAWLLQMETAFVFLAPAAVVMFWRADGERRIVFRFLGVFVAAVWLSYLFYLPFDAWSYLRFLLPAFPAMFVLAVVAVAAVLVRVAGAQRAAAAGVLLAIPLLAVRVEQLREHRILDARITGVVYLSAVEYVRTKLPANAVVLTVQHSGSLRHYTNRLTMRWDLLAPEWWPGALDVLVMRGYRPYLLIASYEEAQFRRQFALSDAVDAPGTVIAEMTLPEAIRIYDPLRQTQQEPDAIPRVDVCPCGLDAPEKPVEFSSR